MNLPKILIGGCSSSGKTTVAESLSKHFGVIHYPLDNVRKSSSHPIFRELCAAEAWDNNVEDLVDVIKQIGTQLVPAIEQWCARTDHGVLEGEGIEPELTLKLSRVKNLKAVYVVETDCERLHATLFDRARSYRDCSPERQRKVVAMNAQYSRYIKSEALRCNQPWVHSQPWPTLHQRVLAMIT